MPTKILFSRQDAKDAKHKTTNPKFETIANDQKTSIEQAHFGTLTSILSLRERKFLNISCLGFRILVTEEEEI